MTNIIVDNHLLHGQPETKFCVECGYENAIGEECPNGCDKPIIEDELQPITQVKNVFESFNEIF